MNVRDLILRHENRKLLPYDDATGERIAPGYTLKGHITIGEGRALDIVGISPDENDLMRENDLRAATADLWVIFGSKWMAFGEARQAALTDMRYTLGGAGFRNFHKLITAALNNKWDVAAAEALDSQWARVQAPERAAEIHDLLLSEKWPA
jgi:hypothetical protein